MNEEVLKPNYYAIIPSQVRYDKNLRANEKLLYGEITALANHNGECWATNKYFADLYEVSKGTVSRWIKHLIDLKYIKTKIVYKYGSQEVDKRIILINEPIDYSVNRYCQNNQYPIDKNVKDIKENNTSNSNNNIEDSDFIKIFELIEKEFGRTISPLEVEKIREWNYSYEIVKLAVKEAVIRNTFSIKYIDKIIYKWKKANVRTVKEAETYIQKFNENRERGNQSRRRGGTIDADCYREF